MPSVSRISIAPVKGLGLVHPDSVLLEDTGVRENRRFHIVDADGRRFNQLRDGGLVQIRPEYDANAEYLTLTFPDGPAAAGTVALGDEITTDFYGRPVTGQLVEGPWSAALSTWLRRPLRLVQSSPGAAVDRNRGEVSLVSAASLAALAEQGGRDAPVDGRRFRMLFELEGCEPHEEDGWVKRHVQIGDAVVKIRGDVGTLRHHDAKSGDRRAGLRHVAHDPEYRPFSENEAGKRHIPFGVFGEVTEPGRVAIGDAVESSS